MSGCNKQKSRNGHCGPYYSHEGNLKTQNQQISEACSFVPFIPSSWGRNPLQHTRTKISRERIKLATFCPSQRSINAIQKLDSSGEKERQIETEAKTERRPNRLVVPYERESERKLIYWRKIKKHAYIHTSVSQVYSVTIIRRTAISPITTML